MKSLSNSSSDIGPINIGISVEFGQMMLTWQINFTSSLWIVQCPVDDLTGYKFLDFKREFLLYKVSAKIRQRLCVAFVSLSQSNVWELDSYQNLDQLQQKLG